ncbi:MAG: DUF4330 domain-containing protein [Cyanobacteria bacterium]|nr:DUF4330 domain-containing protein [Cyanobacteria bacterium CG_2015-16_32_12]NCO77130.1 DUF4330 domain-containing protein [Cyanobacteria bacterium CG_2015-22_32_23]NCQ05299.1 DUF4330 domain-containing protein [Cyanobacteria bacterium CG_2015-09_32_10]NCQ42590.1 DUF4330 domain-containing protein [Cyanobacteria bacterium CG_2015-04_32_10]NCS84892.1 DUF4330 domain-containing protein [Cyanobacteria bacterium CG_2015-02_32_10]
MKIVDSKGRLFGKVNILDLGAIAVIILVLIGIFVVPGPKGSIAQVGAGNTDTIELNLLVRGLSVKDPDSLLKQFNQQANINIIVRNEPAGKLTVESAERLKNYVIVPQPDGSVKALLDPRPETFSLDMMLLLAGKGQMTDDGAILANQKIKIGTVLELDGTNYNFRGSVIGVNKRK